MPLEINYDDLPPHIRGGVKRYIEEGILPGDFLQAVICNNLKESFMCADEINTQRMWSIVNFFYNEAPANCWGSKERMILWHYSRFFKTGTQIVYIPNHAEDENDSVCEEGFVTSINEKGVFCRYWSKHEPGTLRTMANSELTPFDNLIIKDTHSPRQIETMLNMIKDVEED